MQLIQCNNFRDFEKENSRSMEGFCPNSEDAGGPSRRLNMAVFKIKGKG
jgi:hypothetical protein